MERRRRRRVEERRIFGRIKKRGRELVLLFNSRLKIFPGKLKSRWSGPFMVSQVNNDSGVVTLKEGEREFKVNGQRCKQYLGGGGETRETWTIEVLEIKDAKHIKSKAEKGSS